jgi:hypothetical protein
MSLCLGLSLLRGERGAELRVGTLGCLICILVHKLLLLRVLQVLQVLQVLRLGLVRDVVGIGLLNLPMVMDRNSLQRRKAGVLLLVEHVGLLLR